MTEFFNIFVSKTFFVDFEDNLNKQSTVSCVLYARDSRFDGRSINLTSYQQNSAYINSIISS